MKKQKKIDDGSNRLAQATPLGTTKIDTDVGQRFMTKAELESLGLSDEKIQKEYERLIGPLEVSLVGSDETLQTKGLRARVYSACCVRWYADD